MAAITDHVITPMLPEMNYRMIMVTAPATADSGDTLTVNLYDYGIGKLLFIVGNTHTTANSVVITEAPTTSVTSGVLTVTIGGASNNQIRTYLIFGAPLA